MLPKFCNGCVKADVTSMDGLHPFITAVSKCSVYPITSWVERRGCAFNATLTGARTIKLNPLKASKRARKGR
jgi:hypothetical protein